MCQENFNSKAGVVTLTLDKCSLKREKIIRAMAVSKIGI